MPPGARILIRNVALRHGSLAISAAWLIWGRIIALACTRNGLELPVITWPHGTDDIMMDRIKHLIMLCEAADGEPAVDYAENLQHDPLEADRLVPLTFALAEVAGRLRHMMPPEAGADQEQR